MWYVIAEEAIECTECGHSIRSGTDCLSQIPPDLPDDFGRHKYENFCIECAECNTERGLRARPCFMRRLDRYSRKKKPTEFTRCVYCGKPIPKGKSAVAYNFYEWPDLESGSGNEIPEYDDSDIGNKAFELGLDVAVKAAHKAARVAFKRSPIVAGVGMIIVAGGYLLFRSFRGNMPYDEYALFFCKDGRCKSRFARDVTKAALDMQQ